MKSGKIQLGGFELDTLEFASQGNAILGIRDSGKSYTATYLAEQLSTAGIPFIVIDPVGIWRFLKVAGKGKGFPVVVAHPETGDVKLTEENAPDIVRAAMTSNVPLILDLYSTTFSKGAWRRIVEHSVNVLMYENRGLRHIFMEEAAEFVPQIVRGEHAKVYSEIERLARMGGNKQLGYTLINQRAEEVNKSVLELCDCLFLHRQKGRNSLTHLSKWLDFGDKSKTRAVIEGIGRAGPGEVWLWPRQQETPQHVRIPEKQSFHPDRRAIEKGGPPKALPQADVSKFVAKLNAELDAKKPADPEPAGEAEGPIAHDIAERLRQEIDDLRRQLAQQPQRIPVFNTGEIARLQIIAEDLALNVKNLAAVLTEIRSALELADKLSIVRAEPLQEYKMPPLPAARASKLQIPREVGTLGPLRGGEQYVLKTLAAHHPLKMSMAQLGTLAGYTPSTMKSYMPALRTGGFIEEDDAGLFVTQKGFALFGGKPPDMPRTKQEIRELWLSRLSEGPSRLLSILINHRGRPISSEQLARESEYTPSTLKSYLPILRKNKLIHAAELTVSPDLL